MVKIKSAKKHNSDNIEIKDTSIDTEFNFKNGKFKTKIKSDNPNVENTLPFVFLFVLIIIMIFVYFIITKWK